MEPRMARGWKYMTMWGHGREWGRGRPMEIQGWAEKKSGCFGNESTSGVEMWWKCVDIWWRGVCGNLVARGVEI